MLQPNNNLYQKQQKATKKYNGMLQPNNNLYQKQQKATKRYNGMLQPNNNLYQKQQKATKKYNGMLQPNRHCCLCCNATNGWVSHGCSWIIKSSSMTKDEYEICQLNATKDQQNNKKPSKLLNSCCKVRVGTLLVVDLITSYELFW